MVLAALVALEEKAALVDVVDVVDARSWLMVRAALRSIVVVMALRARLGSMEVQVGAVQAVIPSLFIV